MGMPEKRDPMKEKKDREFKFEPAMERLEKIVRELEGGKLTLEESIARFEEGVKLARELRDYLDSARQRVEALVGEDCDGRPLLEPFEESADEEEDEG
jgi:exodeoxyribonuclease VII small subunit